MSLRPTAVVALVANIWLGGCAGTVEAPIPPQRSLAEVLKPGDVLALPVYDPIERWNRGVYTFNAGLDRVVILPIVHAYEFITPELVRNRIRDFFSNLTEIPTFANAILQLKPETAGRAAVRFIDNVLFGFGGLYDIAGEVGGVAQIPEDFGQTLGHWGVGNGPYLVLPLLGPSNLRDTSGLVVDSAGFSLLIPPGVKSSTAYVATAYGLRPIDRRSNTPFRYYGNGSPFEYDFVRLIYTRTREFQIAR
jgi:phospholipid-binding lipoprotein MlaA